MNAQGKPVLYMSLPPTFGLPRWTKVISPVVRQPQSGRDEGGVGRKYRSRGGHFGSFTAGSDAMEKEWPLGSLIR